VSECKTCKRTDIKCCPTCNLDGHTCDVCHHCGCDCPEWVLKIQTNADRIRAMSDEELAEFMAERYSNEVFMRLIDEGCTITESARCALKRDLYVVWLEWLKEEADNPELGGDT